MDIQKTSLYFILFHWFQFNFISKYKSRNIQS